ncbi:hypothetical protein QBC34DRAFT_86755 [Podospora aff. communis PSN243]|uniref:BTB domain-containing protein n=1 Tax=Podospora aff. communis PSN243 TaxID=3040156 RepID=A0AAV9GN18_9PEZI|nr:hypothetical protein QBC34DRAFT_86755 [Podospora aff. communis PSN243]
MAPINGASKPAKNAARRTTSKVIPVLPLYPQRLPTKQPSAPPKSSPLADAQPQTQAEEKNKEVSKPAEVKLNGARETAPSEDPANRRALAHIANGVDDTPSAAVNEPAAPVDLSSEPAPSSAALSTGTSTVIAGPSDHSVASPTPTRPAGPMLGPSSTSSVQGSVRDRTVPAQQPTLSFRPNFHQAHPSNGSLIFGGFHGSNASSPAPASGSGFPAPSVAPAFHHPVAPVDNYGRPLMVSPSYDGFPPAMMNHQGPPTPHSIHGSQTSAQAEDHNYGRWIPAYSQLADTNGAFLHPYTTPTLPPGSGSATVYPNVIDHETLAFFQSAADDNTYHDCYLEVIFPDPAQVDHPDYRRLRRHVRIPAHRFVLSRSPTLQHLMKAQHVDRGGGVVQIDFQNHGEYMRSDVFNYVIRTLYGWPLGNGILPSDLPVRNPRDDFSLLLAYMEVSRYLQLGRVHSAAMQRALPLVRWDTLDLAANFVLPRVVLTARPGADGLRDEPSITGLLRQFLDFIVRHFPKDFILDVKADGLAFSRLPIAPPTQSTSQPAVANGSTNGLANGHHIRQGSSSQGLLPLNHRSSANPRLSQIKFGDLSLPEQNGSVPADPVRSPRVASANDKLLSQILLNLPYEHLKHVLEAPDLGASTPGGGDFLPAARFAMINDIIAEREARRLRTLEKSHPGLEVFQDTLEKAAAPLVVNQIGDFWVNNMGHKEEVSFGDIPFLVHTWSSPGSGSVSA